MTSDTERHTFTWSQAVNLKTPVDRFAAFAAFWQPFRRHLNAALLPSYVNAAQTVEVIHGNRGAATNHQACPPHSALAQTHTFRLCAHRGWNAPGRKPLVTTSVDKSRYQGDRAGGRHAGRQAGNRAERPRAAATSGPGDSRARRVSDRWNGFILARTDRMLTANLLKA